MGVAPRNTLPPFPLTGGGYSGGKSGGHWNVGTSGAPAYMQCRITDTTWLRVRCCSTRRRRGLAAPRPCVMALGCGGAWAATNPVLAPSSSGVSDPRVCSWAHGHRTRGSPPATTCPCHRVQAAGEAWVRAGGVHGRSGAGRGAVPLQGRLPPHHARWHGVGHVHHVGVRPLAAHQPPVRR